MGTILTREEFRAEVRQRFVAGAAGTIAETVAQVFKERAVGQELRTEYALAGAGMDCGQYEMQWRNEIAAGLRGEREPVGTGATGGGRHTSGSRFGGGGSVAPPITGERKRISVLENFCLTTNPERERLSILDYTAPDFDFAIANFEARMNTFYVHGDVLRKAKKFNADAKVATARELDDDRLADFEKLFQDWE